MPNRQETNVGLTLDQTVNHSRGENLGRNALDALPWWDLLRHPRFGAGLKAIIDAGKDASDLVEKFPVKNPNDLDLASFLRLAPPSIEHIRRYDFVSDTIKRMFPISNSSTRKALEVGVCCGEGAARVLGNVVNTDITGVDINPVYIAEAKRLHNDKLIQFVQGDALSLPFSENSFDVVFSFETIEHTPKPQDAIKEISRVLKPGGIAIISAPNNLCLPGIARGVVNKSIETSHFAEPTPDEFEQWMRDSFTLVDLYGQSFIPNEWLPLKGLEGVALTAGNNVGIDLDSFLTTIRRSVRLNGIATAQIEPLSSNFSEKSQPITLIGIGTK